MAHEKLNSERVNYLIWRYLQEAGFGQSAARLQRDWGITDPEQLPFAPHIGPHGLVRLLQNGLRHHGIKASLKANGKEPTLFFGPEVNVKDQIHDESSLAQKPSTPLQRREVENLTNGAHAESALQASAPKRSRRSNGALNGSKAKSGESMDIDDNVPTKNENDMDIDGQENGSSSSRGVADSKANINAAASGEADYSDTNGVGTGSGASHLQVQEQQLIPTYTTTNTLTNGVSVGVQSEKLTDLGHETAVLHLPGKNLTQAAWNPKHPTLLAAGGSALCRIWSLANAGAGGNDASAQSGTASSAPGQATGQATATDTDTSHSSLTVSPAETVDLEIEGTASVTALAWSPAGDQIAYATFPEGTTSIQRSLTTIWNSQGSMEDQLAGGTEPVISLAWSPNGRYLAIVSGRTLSVYDKKLEELLPSYDCENSLLDAVWLKANDIAICGESTIAVTSISEENKIVKVQVLSDPALQHDWSQMRYDSHTSTIAVASEESGHLALVEEAGGFHVEKAHETTLTGLSYRPMVNSDAISSTARRLLATSSVDGVVKVWNGRAGLQHIHTFNLGAAALSLCFTPDGRHVAAASWNKMLFWSAQDGGSPKAIWDAAQVDSHARLPNGDGHANGISGLENGDIEMEDEGEYAPCLTWDSNGHKLALACKDKVTIINYSQ